MFTQNEPISARINLAERPPLPDNRPISPSKSAQNPVFHQNFDNLREELPATAKSYPQLYPCYTALIRSYTSVVRSYAVFIPNLLDTFLPNQPPRRLMPIN
jgi:hypothetical protein